MSIKLMAATVGFSMLLSAPVFAKKSDSDEHKEHHNAASYKQKHDDDHGHQSENKHQRSKKNSYFDLDRKKKIHTYYGAKKSRYCPPGLAKKSHGCTPPGQAKRWTKGQPLQADVVYYNLPSNLLYELGQTPRGQKVVRVGEDILLINAVTGLVIDAIEQVFQ